jgi:hypothetical protein
LLIALLRVYRLHRSRALFGVLGVLLTLVASLAQQARIDVHPRYFDHNALYHVLEAVALLFLWYAARSLLVIALPVRPGLANERIIVPPAT